jgi:hypothetical protein
MLGSHGDGKYSRERGKGGSRMLRRVPRSLRGRVRVIECSLGQMVCSSSYVFPHLEIHICEER